MVCSKLQKQSVGSEKKLKVSLIKVPSEWLARGKCYGPAFIFLFTPFDSGSQTLTNDFYGFYLEKKFQKCS